MPRVLIIGATGIVGRAVISELIDAKVSVRAVTRNPDSANLPAAAEVVGADLTIPDSLDGPLESVDAVFMVWTAPASAAAPALTRIAEGVRRIVYLSAPHNIPHPFFQQPNPMATLHRQNERLIEASGMHWTFLRPGMFAANTRFWWGAQIRANQVVRWPYANAPTAPIHERDIAAVAARALLEPGHAGGDYVLTGPQSLTQFDQLSTFYEVLGRTPTYQEISPEEARIELLTIMPLPVINMLLNAWAAAIGQPAYVTSTVGEITGTPARTFRQWVVDHASAFR